MLFYSEYHDGCFVILFALTREREEGSRNASHPVLPLGYVNVAVRSPFCQQSAKEVFIFPRTRKKKRDCEASLFFLDNERKKEISSRSQE
jgi:hypothetical protein